MPVNVKITTNIKEVAESLGTKPRKIASRMLIAVSKATFKVEREAKKHAPVDTGLLRSKTIGSIRGLVGSVRSFVNYATFVHEGTRYITGNPYLTRGLASSRSFIREVFRNEIRRAIR